MYKKYFKHTLHLFKSDKFILIPVLISILSTLIIILLFLLTYSNLPKDLPLFYSLSWGAPQLVSKNQFLLIPIIVIFISLTNLGITSQLHSSQQVLRKTLLISIALVSLLFLITALNILFIFL